MPKPSITPYSMPLMTLPQPLSMETKPPLLPPKNFLNYAACNPNAEIKFRASSMIFKVESDAAYLVAPIAWSCAGGYHYFGNADDTLFNRPILVLAKIIKNVMLSAAEAKIGSIFLNAREAIPIRNCCLDLGHP